MSSTITPIEAPKDAVSYAVVYAPPSLRPGQQASVLARLATEAEASEFIGALAATDRTGVDAGHYGIDGPCPEPPALPACPGKVTAADGEVLDLLGCGSGDLAWEVDAGAFTCRDCGFPSLPNEALDRRYAP